MSPNNTSQHNANRSSCRRCGGAFTRDQDGDLTCLICGRPARSRRWEPATRDEAVEGWALS